MKEFIKYFEFRLVLAGLALEIIIIGFMKHTSIWNKIASSFSIAFSYFIIIGVINSLLRHYFVKFFNNNKSNDQKQLDTIINKATFAIMTTIAVIEIFSLIAFKTSPLAGLGSLILNKFFGSNSGIDE